MLSGESCRPNIADVSGSRDHTSDIGCFHPSLHVPLRCHPMLYYNGSGNWDNKDEPETDRYNRSIRLSPVCREWNRNLRNLRPIYRTYLWYSRYLSLSPAGLRGRDHKGVAPLLSILYSVHIPRSVHFSSTPCYLVLHNGLNVVLSWMKLWKGRWRDFLRMLA